MRGYELGPEFFQDFLTSSHSLSQKRTSLGLRRLGKEESYFVSFGSEADFGDSSPHSWFPLCGDGARGAKLPHGYRAIQGTCQI